MLFFYVFLVICEINKGISLEFPNDFKFGVATASYQIEGAWNENGKGENIWDRLTHDHPSLIKDKTNGDIACDSYHKTDEDVKILQWLGVDLYRFSLSWSRLLPTGYVNEINQDGVNYYNNLIDSLVKKNITPMVTLYHWDLPQPLQEVGGMPNVLLADYFEDYARFAFKTFGDRVKLWITFNEPPEICQSGYGDASLAPAYRTDGIAPYLCGRTLLISHARAYRVYDKEFREKQNGKVGISINANWLEPATDSEEDINATNRAMEMTLGWWAHPIFSKSGDYPKIMEERIAEISKKENFPRSRLIPFTPDEVRLIQGTYDFFGLNHYTTYLVTANTSTIKWKTPSYAKDIGVYRYFDPSWPGSSATWLKVVPWGFRKLLRWIKDEYNNPIIYVTENGYADTGELKDSNRIRYYKDYLNALLEAIHIDGVKVKGYTAWSVLDNFEWFQGFSMRFGLFYVDINSLNRTRTAKDSAFFYKNVIKQRSIDMTPSVVKMN